MCQANKWRRRRPEQVILKRTTLSPLSGFGTAKSRMPVKGHNDGKIATTKVATTHAKPGVLLAQFTSLCGKMQSLSIMTLCKLCAYPRVESNRLCTYRGVELGNNMNASGKRVGYGKMQFGMLG